jgi:uncharacterized membrane protein (DUF4010 family)
VAELAGYLSSASGDITSLAIRIDLLTVIAMFIRNLLILVFFARTAALTAAGPLIAMILLSVLFLWQQRKKQQTEIGELKLSSPLQLSRVLKFGVIFLVIEILGTLAQRYFGHLGFLVVSIVGGLVSSASTAGAAATLAMHGTIPSETAGIATVLTSVTSALSNLPMIHQQVWDWRLTRKLVLVSGVVILVGLVIVGVSLAGNLTW